MKYYYLKSKLNDYKSKYGEITSDLLIEKKSKFIAYIFSINKEEEAKKYIEAVIKDNKEARHVVYIYSYIEYKLPVIRYSDDGEPSRNRYKSYKWIIK